MEIPQINIRSIEMADYNFIFNSWLKCYKNNSYFAKRIRNNVFFKYHHQVVERILDRASTRVLMAVSILDPNVVYGYLVTEKFDDNKDILHFTYIKEAFRKFGIGKELIKASGINPNEAIISHWTFDIDELSKKFPNMSYCPYLI